MMNTKAARKPVDAAKTAREVMPKDNTSLDVINWALGRTARVMAQWGLADLEKDSPAMLRFAQEIRQIATRMERYRRWKVKLWTAAASANSKPESHPK